MVKILIRSCTITVTVFLLMPVMAVADQEITATLVDTVPVIDGNSTDAAWRSAGAIVTRDRLADIDVTIKAVHDKRRIFFLVQFPDPDESREHRNWIWDESDHRYRVGPEREDCFVFKWFMHKAPVDPTLLSIEEHTADTWFWKARRTDPVGFADDKIQRLRMKPARKAVKLTNRNGSSSYLQRLGDRGDPAYDDMLYSHFIHKSMPRYINREPTKSRADIRAKGLWINGTWSIEFSRKLQTGQGDDVQFDISQEYVFGISRYEIAGRAPDYNTTQPLYGAGDVSETLHLRFLQ